MRARSGSWTGFSVRPIRGQARRRGIAGPLARSRNTATSRKGRAMGPVAPHPTGEFFSRTVGFSFQQVIRDLKRSTAISSVTGRVLFAMVRSGDCISPGAAFGRPTLLPATAQGRAVECRACCRKPCGGSFCWRVGVLDSAWSQVAGWPVAVRGSSGRKHQRGRDLARFCSAFVVEGVGCPWG